VFDTLLKLQQRLTQRVSSLGSFRARCCLVLSALVRPILL